MGGPVIESFIENDDALYDGPIAYLDRDGVLNIGSPNYINSPDELVIIVGVKDAIDRLRKYGYKIVIVTNQSAISRGLWGVSTLSKIHEKMQNEIGKIDLIITCPHLPFEKCNCRKPMPGMLFRGSEILRDKCHDGVDWWGSKPKPIHRLDCMVGDRDSDMGAGWAVGARLFKVNCSLGLPSVIDRILSEDNGDEFSPVN